MVSVWGGYKSDARDLNRIRGKRPPIVLEAHLALFLADFRVFASHFARILLQGWQNTVLPWPNVVLEALANC